MESARQIRTKEDDIHAPNRITKIIRIHRLIDNKHGMLAHCLSRMMHSKGDAMRADDEKFNKFEINLME
jgi:hypothetical protein